MKPDTQIRRSYKGQWFAWQGTAWWLPMFRIQRNIRGAYFQVGKWRGMIYFCLATFLFALPAGAQQKEKPWYKSKQFWISTAISVAAAAAEAARNVPVGYQRELSF